MKTDELIALLARGPVAVAPAPIGRRLLAASGSGLLLALVVVLALLGIRPDFAAALHLPMFWCKLVVPLAVAALAFVVTRRLARPGVHAGAAPVLGAVLLALLWAAAALDVANAPAAERGALVLGASALPCVVTISLLALPLLFGLFAALRSLAPTRLAAAGAAAGALAGGLAAAAYALHCDETALPFLAVWYVLGMAVPAIAGALLAPRLLRWS